MRIALIIPRLEKLGPVLVIQALANSLRDNNRLLIEVFYLDKSPDKEVKMRVPVKRFNSATFDYFNYDIIHTNGIRPDFLAFIHRKKIRYHISTIHNFVFADLEYSYNRCVSWIFGNVWIKLWKRADKLVCVSESMKEYYQNWFHPSKLEVIYNGIEEPDNSLIPDSDIIKDLSRLRSEGLRIIGTAAILTRRKGIDQLLDLVASEFQSALVVFGDGRELDNLRDLAKMLKIADRCRFYGFRSEAASYLRYIDIFALPSRSEGFGLALIEAVSQKVPVMCSDIAVFKELFAADEVTFFKSEDRSSLTEAFRSTIEAGFLKTEKAYAKYQKKYTDRAMASGYAGLYESLLKSKYDSVADRNG
jgi:L-malate glycosyltransferase